MSKKKLKKYKRPPKPSPPWGEEFWPRRYAAKMTPEQLAILRDQMAYERVVKEMAEIKRQKCC